MIVFVLISSLILDSSADSEKEENMVEWLREVGMPADYVNKLARMFQDIKVSVDLNARFHASTARHDAINIKILNAGAWAQCTERVSVSFYFHFFFCKNLLGKALGRSMKNIYSISQGEFTARVGRLHSGGGRVLQAATCWP